MKQPFGSFGLLYIHRVLITVCAITKKLNVYPRLVFVEVTRNAPDTGQHLLGWCSVSPALGQPGDLVCMVYRFRRHVWPARASPVLSLMGSGRVPTATPLTLTLPPTCNRAS